jgi:hypothetical protein
MATVVFVSSTFLDLQEHRRLVQDAIARLEHGTRTMEFFGALSNSPREECLRLIRASEVFPGIVGMRYGSLDPETGKSLRPLNAVVEALPYEMIFGSGKHRWLLVPSLTSRLLLTAVVAAHQATTCDFAAAGVAHVRQWWVSDVAFDGHGRVAADASTCGRARWHNDHMHAPTPNPVFERPRKKRRAAQFCRWASCQPMRRSVR